MRNLISVIVPVYNVEKYVEECIRSIMEQSYPAMQVLIVNDGSTDGSAEICERLCEMDSRLRLIAQKNAGLSEARNTGIDQAEGEYICFVDSDDTIKPYFIERLMNLIAGTGAQMAQCELYSSVEEEKQKSTYQIYKASEYLERLINDQIPSYFCGKIFKKELFHDFRFPLGKTYEDLLMMPMIIERCRSIVATSEKLYFYRRRWDSITNHPRYRIQNQRAISQAFSRRFHIAKERYPSVRSTALKRAVEANLCAMALVYDQRGRSDEWKEHYVFLNDALKEMQKDPRMKLFLKIVTQSAVSFPSIFNPVLKAGIVLKNRFKMK